jgi:hypothetical protein
MLTAILSTLPTSSLLPLVRISRRFYAVTMCILHSRLKHAARLPAHRLILECYHPSDKLTTPYVFCDYLHTDPLPPDDGGAGGEYRFPEHTVAGLRGLYSHFRPVVQDENRRPRLRYPTAAQAQAQAQAQQAAEDGQSSVPEPAAPELVSQALNLDEGELFSQLCTVTNLVKVAPQRGLFLSHVNVSEGVMRVRRDWLAAQAATSDEEREADIHDGSSSTSSSSSSRGASGPILWADAEHNVGLRFRVVEQEAQGSFYRRPLMVSADEDLPVSYRLEFEELLVRSHRLLLMVEKSEVQEVNDSGKAIVIASI